MAHRLLHSLVFSSVMVLEGLGCAVSHHGPDEDPPAPPPPPRHFDPPVDDGGLPGDAGGEDSGAPQLDAGEPADPADAGDPRLCEPGWPTTKASYCAVVDMDSEFERIVCCNSFGEEPCCTASEDGPEVTERLIREEP